LKRCGTDKRTGVQNGSGAIGMRVDMGTLTGTRYGDAANALFAFYHYQAQELEESGHYFMAAIALAFALEAAVLTYLLVEFGEDNGGELQIPASVNMSELIEAANAIDVLTAPINIPLLIGYEGAETPPKHVAKDVIDKLRRFRNLIHPARALKEGYDPQTFTSEQLAEFKHIYETVMHSLLYNL
jgi:hypothetical protein